VGSGTAVSRPDDRSFARKDSRGADWAEGVERLAEIEVRRTGCELDRPAIDVRKCVCHVVLSSQSAVSDPAFSRIFAVEMTLLSKMTTLSNMADWA
jgi:hypothetical protein